MNVLSCLSSSVQCSPAKLLPNYLNPIHSPTPSWTMQPHITGLPSNAHAIPPHACPHIMGHTAPLAYHTHLCHHTPTLTALCTHSVSHANAIRAAHRCTCTFIYTQHNHVAHLHISTRSTHAHTQNMNTCQCWSTHILTHTHECTHTYMHARTNHTHTHTHVYI